MTTSILPKLNKPNLYTFASPINTYIQSNVIYTCRSLRHISDYIHANEDLLSLAYTPYGLDQSVLDTDSINNEIIVGLQSVRGGFIYAPAKYILSVDNLNDVTYNKKGISISLGFLPDDIDLTNFISNLSDLTVDMIGVTPVIKSVVMSDDISVTLAHHNNATQLRVDNQSPNNLSSNITKIAQLTALAASRLQHIQLLEQEVLTLRTP